MDALWPKLLLWLVVVGARSAVCVAGAALDADICDEASLLANPGHLRPHLQPAARHRNWEADTGRPTAPPLNVSLPLGGQPSGAEERSEPAARHRNWEADTGRPTAPPLNLSLPLGGQPSGAEERSEPTGSGTRWDCMAVGEQGCIMNESAAQGAALVLTSAGLQCDECLHRQIHFSPHAWHPCVVRT
eukprot:CAMPEP_0204114002 /NCGR_PEP_ID=MMETSP0361-20130328/3992_1 /ASSEMBLY_ACC=CAM_ASM_000343 /TAXON_ID=268821 /ORGANISM="Scrippsiella Hangoei, Strain SHTV-5" /LENGTH=187 /DNA_ID=CAMNT_0051064463 /DNA_START=77 /DNA_END=637 /DNA_ORIENTATION=-